MPRSAVVRALPAARIVPMTGVQIEGVEERNNNWESLDPRFRVYLHGREESSTYGWTDTYDITGADVVQVVDWAQRQAGDLLTYAIALVYDDEARERRSPGHGRGLMWLVGMDGNDSPADPRDVDAQKRMLARRRAPVRLPSADLMPPAVPDPYNDRTESR